MDHWLGEYSHSPVAGPSRGCFVQNSKRGSAGARWGGAMPPPPAHPFLHTHSGPLSCGGCFQRSAVCVTPHPVSTALDFYASAFEGSQFYQATVALPKVPKCRRYLFPGCCCSEGLSVSKGSILCGPIRCLFCFYELVCWQCHDAWYSQPTSTLATPL